MTIKQTIAIAIIAFCLNFCAVVAVSQARGGSSSSSSSSSSRSSGGSSSSGTKCCSSSAKTSGSSKSSGSTKPSSPSSGSKTAPPVTKTVPVKPPSSLTPKVSNGKIIPPKVTPPTGRSYTADSNAVRTQSYRDRNGNSYHYYDPYGPRYYGYYNPGFGSGVGDNLYFYLWMSSMMDDDRSNNPLPPESDTEISGALTSYMQIIKQEQSITANKDKEATP